MPTLTVDGADRIDVGVGEAVTFVGRVDMPPGAGVIVDAEFDFDGSGEFPEHHRPTPGGDGPLTSVSFTTTHALRRTRYVLPIDAGHVASRGRSAFAVRPHPEHRPRPGRRPRIAQRSNSATTVPRPGATTEPRSGKRRRR